MVHLGYVIFFGGIGLLAVLFVGALVIGVLGLAGAAVGSVLDAIAAKIAKPLAYVRPLIGAFILSSIIGAALAGEIAGASHLNYIQTLWLIPVCMIVPFYLAYSWFKG